MFTFAANALALSPLIILPLAWIRWIRKGGKEVIAPHRRLLLAIGLTAASVSSVCSAWLFVYFRTVHIGYWNEYLVLTRWVVFNWPLSVLALVLGLTGKGPSRLLLMFSACVLTLVWTAAANN